MHRGLPSGRAAVDRVVGACDVRRPVRSDEPRELHDLLGLTEALEKRLPGDRIPDRLVVPEVAVAGWGQDYSDAITYFGPLLTCPDGEPTGSNYGRFCDEEFDADVQEISEMPTGKERATAFAELSFNTMKEKAPWWPLTNRRKVSFVSDRVGNYMWGPGKQFYFGSYFIKDA